MVGALTFLPTWYGAPGVTIPSGQTLRISSGQLVFVQVSWSVSSANYMCEFTGSSVGGIYEFGTGSGSWTGSGTTFSVASWTIVNIQPFQQVVLPLMFVRVMMAMR